MVVARVDRPGEPAADRWAVLGARVRRGLARRPGLVRALRVGSIGWLGVSAVGLVVAWVRVDGWGDAIRPWFWGYLGLALLFVAARTKTVSWRFVAAVFGTGCVLALPIGWAEFRLADLLGLEVEFADGAVLLAGPVEETLKLIPLAAVLLFARRRVRGFAVVDFLLLGYAAGLGFQVVEDGMRPLVASQRTGVSLAELIPGWVPTASYGLSWLPGAWQLRLDDHAYFAGHAVLSGLVAVAIGLAYRLRRRFGPLVLLIPIAMLAMVVVDHAMMNDVASRPFGDLPTPDFPDIDRDRLPEGFDLPPLPSEHEVEVPGWVERSWRLWGRGRFGAPLLTALLLVGMVLDARRADRSIRWLPPLPTPPGVRRMRRWAATTGGFLGAIGHTLASTAHDLVLTAWSLGGTPAITTRYDEATGEWRGSDGSRLRFDTATGLWLSTDRRGATTVSPVRPPVAGDSAKTRPLRRWRTTLAYLRARRQRAHLLAHEDDRHRHPTGLWARAGWMLGLAALAVVAVVVFDALYGGRAASALGPHSAFLADLLRELADWWDGLSFYEKAFVVLAVTGLLTFGVGYPLALGWGFWGTFAAVDAASLAAEHGHGLADLIEDPNAAWDGYWDNFTWQQGAWDAWEVATAVPGHGAGNLADSWRSHIDEVDGMADDAARQADDALTTHADEAAESATRAASPSRTTPSHAPDPTRRPTGTPERIPGSADAETIRGITRQNETADTLAQAGYEVEHRPRIAGSDKQPDYRIEGEIFDCTAPARDTSARSVWTTVKHKVRSEQASRAVLNLDDSGLTIDQLRTQFQDWPISGLEEVMVVRGGQVIPLFP